MKRLFITRINKEGRRDFIEAFYDDYKRAYIKLDELRKEAKENKSYFFYFLEDANYYVENKY